MKSLFSRIKSLLVAAIVAVTLAISLALPAMAATCNGVDTAIEYDCYTQTDGASALALSVLSFLAIGVGITVVGGIVYGAVRYTTANGNAAQAQAAIKIIVGSLIGLILFIFMYSIMNFLLPGGAFNLNPAQKPLQQKTLKDGLDEIIARAQAENEQANSTDPTKSKTNVGASCYDVKVSKADIATKDRFHRKSGQPYAFENSFEGIDYAAKHGYKAIDIDVMVTKDGVLVGSHAWKPLESGIMGGFKDPLGKLKKDTRLSEMTLAEVSRLRHEDGYKISTLEDLIIHAKTKGINLILEMKVPKEIEKQLPHVAAILNEYDVKAGITSRKDKPGYVHALAVARSLGFNTRMASSPGATAKDRTWVSPDKDAALCAKLKG